MPPFSARPTENDAAQHWVTRAPLTTSGATPRELPSAQAAPPSGEDLDPKAPATKTFNLRLNEHELELLRRVAAAEFCSQQAIAKRILIRALTEAAAKL